MTRIDKTVAIAVVVFVVGVGVLTYRVITEVEAQGGVRGVVISAGKDIKSIIKEINDE